MSLEREREQDHAQKICIYLQKLNNEWRKQSIRSIEHPMMTAKHSHISHLCCVDYISLPRHATPNLVYIISYFRCDSLHKMHVFVHCALFCIFTWYENHCREEIYKWMNEGERKRGRERREKKRNKNREKKTLCETNSEQFVLYEEMSSQIHCLWNKYSDDGRIEQSGGTRLMVCLSSSVTILTPIGTYDYNA